MKTCPKCKVEKPVEEFSKNRSTKDGLQHYCKPCSCEWAAEYRENNEEQYRESSRRYYESNKEQRKVSRRKYYENNKERFRGYNLKKEYGITLEEYKDMVKMQNSKCLICGEFEEILCVDHCHKSDEVRGLLCGPCNMGLGGFKDNPSLLEEAAAYLRR